MACFVGVLRYDRPVSKWRYVGMAAVTVGAVASIGWLVWPAIAEVLQARAGADAPPPPPPKIRVAAHALSLEGDPIGMGAGAGDQRQFFHDAQTMARMMMNMTDGPSRQPMPV